MLNHTAWDRQILDFHLMSPLCGFHSFHSRKAVGNQPWNESPLGFYSGGHTCVGYIDGLC